jgi:hypothetical protein
MKLEDVLSHIHFFRVCDHVELFSLLHCLEDFVEAHKVLSFVVLLT